MLLVPLKDDNPTRSFALLTAIFIAVNVAVFVHQATLVSPEAEEFILRFGMIPAVLTGAAYVDEALNPPPAWTTVFSAMFLHGSLMHLAGNMLYLWTFGNNIEDAMGRVRFLVFYALCGLAAVVAQGAADPSSTTPMIGASGAVSGVLGAYLLLHPHAQVWSFAFFRFAWLPAWAVLGFWIVVQFANAFLADPEQGGVAWWAHVGGFLAGMALIPIFKRRGAALFEGRNRTGPWG